MKQKTALIFIAYRRVNQILRVLENLQEYGSELPFVIYVFSDGARDEADKLDVDRLRNLLWQVKNPSFELVEREENFGLSKNVELAIDWVAERHESFLVLEDDIEISATALFIANRGVKALGGAEDFGAVCFAGMNPLGRRLEWQATDRFISWGWGTTSKSWERFQLWRDKKDLNKELLVNSIPNSWTIFEKWFVSRMYKKFESLNSWAIPFSVFLREESRLVVSPSANLVKVSGDDFSTHASWHPKMRLPQKMNIAGNWDHSRPSLSSRLRSMERSVAIVAGYILWRLGQGDKLCGTSR